MANNEIRIRITVEGQQASGMLDTLQGKASRLGNVFDISLGNLAADAVRKLTSRLGSLVTQGAELVGMAADIAETQSKFDTVFGTSGEAVQSFADDWATMAGLTRSEAQDLLATTGAIAQGTGMMKKESAAFSVEIAKLAGDLSSFSNANPADTFRALTAALTGEREQLKQYGIVLQETEVQQQALLQTGKARADQLTQEEKATATLALAYQKAGVQVGDLERTKDSAANQGKQLDAQLRTLSETAAGELLPAATAVNAKLLELAQRDDVADAIKSAAAALSEALVMGIDLLTKAVNLVLEYRAELRTAGEVMLWVTAAAGAYTAATKGLVVAQVAATTASKGLRVAQIALALVTALLTGNTQRAAAAWRLLNMVMRLNPVGLVITAITVAVGLLWRFRKQALDAAAAIVEFGAKAARLAGMTTIARGLEMAADKLRGWSKEAEASKPKTDDLADATADLGEAADGAATSTDTLTTATKAAKTAFQEATEAVKNLRAELADLLKNDPERLAALQKEADELQKQIDARKALIELMARGDAPDEARKVDLSPTAGMQKDLENRQAMRERELEAQRAHDEALAESTEQAQGRIAASLEASALVSAEKTAEQVEAQRQLREAFQASLEQQLSAADASIESVGDVANAVVDAARQQIMAYLAKALAAVIAESLAAMGPLAPVLGPAAAAGIAATFNLLWNKFIPRFATGGYVSGPGGPKEDRIPAMLSNGEFVVNARATQANLPLLRAINRGTLPKMEPAALLATASTAAAAYDKGGALSMQQWEAVGRHIGRGVRKDLEGTELRARGGDIVLAYKRAVADDELFN